jgi:hypothetical protein
MAHTSRSLPPSANDHPRCAERRRTGEHGLGRRETSTVDPSCRHRHHPLHGRRLDQPQHADSRHRRRAPRPVRYCPRDARHGIVLAHHPAEVGEEDLFYTIRERARWSTCTGARRTPSSFTRGDAIHSHHLTNFTRNHTDADLEMAYSGAPHPPGTIVHTLA